MEETYKITCSIYVSLAEVLTIICGAFFQQQSGAEKTLLSDSNNNELLIINLVKVPADRNIFPGLQ
jgi:hypothetical protein